jgi:CDP-diacylglycerol---serine O-phosphatidyltransferase
MDIKKQIPNLLTLCNLFCGLNIIIAAAIQDFNCVIYWAATALLFDFLDGTAARILKVTSSLGKELDSLADAVSFGAAPALVLYYFWKSEQGDGVIHFSPLIIAVFAAYRLAKFNSTTQNNNYFTGLPTPALALACFAIPQIGDDFEWVSSIINHPLFIVIFSFLGGLLLVSNFKLFSLKIGSSHRTLNILRIILVISSVMLIVWLHFFGVFLCLLIYLGLSLTFQNKIY